MAACCEATFRGKQKTVLTLVLVINAVLFVVEAAAGLLANSTALLADSLDMLGDSLVYGFSLYVLWRSAEWIMMIIGPGDHGPGRHAPSGGPGGQAPLSSITEHGVQQP